MNIIPYKSIKISARNVFIFDGDTAEINYNNDKFISRIRWIDAPEIKKQNQSSSDIKIIKHWEWGEKSRKYLASLINQKNLIIVPAVKDIYSRWLCDWYIEKISTSTNIQLQMCAAGMATSFVEINKYNFFNSRELNLYCNIIKSCAISFRNQSGFWIEPNFLLPSEIKNLNL